MVSGRNHLTDEICKALRIIQFNRVVGSGQDFSCEPNPSPLAMVDTGYVSDAQKLNSSGDKFLISRKDLGDSVYDEWG